MMDFTGKETSYDVRVYKDIKNGHVTIYGTRVKQQIVKEYEIKGPEGIITDFDKEKNIIFVKLWEYKVS